MSCKVAAADIDGRGGDSLSEEKKVVNNCGGCEVTLVFKESAEDIKEKVLWLMLENYKDRILHKALEDVSAEKTDSE